MGTIHEIVEKIGDTVRKSVISTNEKGQEEHIVTISTTYYGEDKFLSSATVIMSNEGNGSFKLKYRPMYRFI